MVSSDARDEWNTAIKKMQSKGLGKMNNSDKAFEEWAENYGNFHLSRAKDAWNAGREATLAEVREKIEILEDALRSIRAEEDSYDTEQNTLGRIFLKCEEALNINLEEG